MRITSTAAVAAAAAAADDDGGQVQLSFVGRRHRWTGVSRSPCASDTSNRRIGVGA